MKKVTVMIFAMLISSFTYAACSTTENVCQEKSKDLFSQSMSGESAIEKLNKKLGFPMGGPGWLVGVDLSAQQQERVQAILEKYKDNECTWADSTVYFEKGFSLISSSNYTDAKAKEAAATQKNNANNCFMSLRKEHEVFSVLTKDQQKKVISRQNGIMFILKEVNSPNLVIKR